MKPADQQACSNIEDRELNTPDALSEERELNTPVPIEDSSDEDDLQVVSEHLVPPEEHQGIPLNLPAGLQAKLLAAVRASNANIPDLSSAKIKIFSRDVPQNSSGGNCRIIMSQTGRETGSNSTSFSIPYSELTQATPSTSKGSRLAGPSPSPELVDLVNQLDESQTSKKLSSANRSDDVRKEVCDRNIVNLPPPNFDPFKEPVDESKEDDEDEVVSPVAGMDEISQYLESSKPTSPEEPEQPVSPDIENSDLFSELAKVQETIANFDAPSEASDSFRSDIHNDFDDEFHVVSPGSKDDDSEHELKNLVSEDESANSAVLTSDLIDLHNEENDSLSLLFSSPKPPAPVVRWNDESCDVEEGQIVNLLDSSSDDDDIMEICRKPPEKMAESEDDVSLELDQFVSKEEATPLSILYNLDVTVRDSNPFLSVSTFDQLFDNFRLDTLRVVQLLENQGELVQDHVVFEGWAITYVSFFVARQIVKLAGGEPKFLNLFLSRTRPCASFVDVSEFRSSGILAKFPPENYFNKTELSDCNVSEFKSLFGLVSHEQATEIKERAKIVKRRLLRPERKMDDFLNKKKKPEPINIPSKKWLVPKASQKNKESFPVSEVSALVSYSLNQKLKDMSNFKPRKDLEKRQETKNSHVYEKTFTETVIPEVPQQNKVETFEVKQTREMKRKGIKLPRGWHIFGKRKISETKSDGHVYQYFRIDWQFRAPDGRNYRSLKRALEVVKLSARREKWELNPGDLKLQQQTKKVPTPPIHVEESDDIEYVTLKDDLEHELDLQLEKDVYSLSGIRPVRKFASDWNISGNIKNSAERAVLFSPTSCPKRMTALKSNPITPAQYQMMMGRVPPHASSKPIPKFSLKDVGEVIGPRNDGWLCSKLENLRRIAPEDVPEEQNEVFYSSPGPLTSHPLTSEGRVAVQIFSESELRTLMDLETYREKHKAGKLAEDCMSTCLARKVARANFALPEGWVTKLSTPKRRINKYNQKKYEFISPKGQVFDNIDSVISFLQFESLPLLRGSKKSVPNTPQKVGIGPMRSLPSPTIIIPSEKSVEMTPNKRSPGKSCPLLNSSACKLLGLSLPDVNLTPVKIPGSFNRSKQSSSSPLKRKLSEVVESPKRSKRGSTPKKVTPKRIPPKGKTRPLPPPEIRSTIKEKKIYKSPVRKCISPVLNQECRSSTPDSLNELLMDSEDDSIQDKSNNEGNLDLNDTLDKLSSISKKASRK